MTLFGTGSAPKTELLINGVWTDFSSRPREAQKIVITRGRQNEQGQVTAQKCQTTLNNRDGVMSNRNPSSPYFGLLPRNTQMRVTAGTATDDVYFKMPYSDQSTSIRGLFTANKAVLGITGDIDIRADVKPYGWRTALSPSGLQGMTFATKGTSDGNLSWAFYILSNGMLKFRWFPTGLVSAALSANSTVPVPATSGRLSVRVTLDVDNGAAGNTVTFYTSDSVTGTWTQLGSAIVQSGTTSIFNSSAQVVFAGGGAAGAKFFSDIPAFGGRFYRGQIYSGIAGTLVADANPASRSIGDTSWSDGLATPNTWTVTGDSFARISSDRVRFVGELSSLPQAWDITGKDVYVPVTASGPIRRLTQGASPLDSPMYRNFNQYTPAGYWPLEDSAGSTQASTPVSSALPAIATAVTFGATPTGLPGASAVAQFQDATSRLQFTLPRVTSTGTISWVFYVRVPSTLPGSAAVIATLLTSGTAAQVRVGLSATTWDTTFLDSNGAVLATSSVANGSINPSTGWVGYNLLLQTSGSDMTYSIRWDAIQAFGGGVGPVTISGARVGVPTGGYTGSSNDASFYTAQTSQWFFSTSSLDLSSDAFRKASSAWAGETAAARLARLAQEQSQPIEITGMAADSEPMGYQLIDTFMANVYDCAETDGGILGECRDLLALSYRTRTALENRTDVTLDYSQSHFSDVPLPTEDDQAFTNDVTVSRAGGSSARAQRTDGPTSVSDPPAGVGRYRTAITRNAYTDDRLPSIAGWNMIVGSWDDARYPLLPIGMHRPEIQNSATLAGQIMQLNLGDTAILANLPSWLPPDSVPELIQGYTETLDKFLWSISYNATPAGPYAVPILGSDVSEPRADATSHTLGGSMDTTATSATFTTPADSAVWVDSTNYPAEFPIPVKIGGEVMSVTAITGTTSPQTATVIRSVNGVVKTHSSGEFVRLATPSYVGR